MYNKKILLALAIFFAFKPVKTFYEEVKIEFEYNFDCKEECQEIHDLINYIYQKISKIWFTLDCFQSIQVGIPENDEIYFEIISDLIRIVDKLEDSCINFNEIKYHQSDLIVLREILKHLLEHATVEKNEILSIIISLIEKKLILYENI